MSSSVRALRRFLLRGVQGACVGAVVGLGEYTAWPMQTGYRLAYAFAVPLMALSAAWTAMGWLVGEAIFALVPRRWRRRSRFVPFVLATAVVLVAAERLDSGGLNIDQPRFQLELAAWCSIAVLVAWTEARFLGSHRMARRLLGVGALGGVLALALLGLDRGEPSSRSDGAPALPGAPNVVVVLVDTLRVDRTSLFGAKRPTTPFLEKLAEESVVYEHAFTPSPWTSPSVASMMTGLRVGQHGLMRFGARFRPTGRTLPEHFASLGYRTFASIANPLISPRHGFLGGFGTTRFPPGDVFVQTRLGSLVRKAFEQLGWEKARVAQFHVESFLVRDGEGLVMRDASRVVEDFASWLDAVKPGRFFAYLHLMEPHAPYDAPRPFRGRFVLPGGDPPRNPPSGPSGSNPRLPNGPIQDPMAEQLAAAYDEELLAVDAAIGSIVGELRRRELLDDTVVAVVSDHGEEFLDHGGWNHGHQCFDELVRGLVVIRRPGGKAKGRVERPISLRTLPSMLAEAAGVPPLPGAEREEVEGPILVELYPSGQSNPGFAAVDFPWKLVRTGAKESLREWLFRLDDDPHETHDLSAAHPEIHERLSRWVDGQIIEPQREVAPLDAETADKLRALGYVQ